MLHRVLPASDQGEHLRPRQLELDRTARAPSRHDAEHHAGEPAVSLAAEAAAHVARDHLHPVERQAEAMGDDAARAEHRLCGRMDRHTLAIPLAIPGRDRGIQLHRIVVVDRRRVVAVDHDFGLGESTLGIAAPAVGRPAAGRLGRKGVGDAL